MKLSEVDYYQCSSVNKYRKVKRELKEDPGIVNKVSNFIKDLNGKSSDELDEFIQEMYKNNELASLARSLYILWLRVEYSRKICEYIDSYKGWYRLTRDVEVRFPFPYGEEKIEIYKKGSYVYELDLDAEHSYYYGDKCYFTIPMNAVEKIGEDFMVTYYSNEEDGCTYYCDWGKWDENNKRYEFEDNPIKTNDMVYLHDSYSY